MASVCLPYMLLAILTRKDNVIRDAFVPPFDGKPLPPYEGSVEPDEAQHVVRDSIRQIRIDDIKSQMMGVFGPNRTIPVFNLSQLKWEINLPNKPASVLQIPPSCTPPRNVDETLWSSTNSYNLFFNLQNLSKRSENIQSAKLVLQRETDFHSELADDSDADSFEAGQKLKVTVYSYNRPLKKSRARKKLIASLWFTPGQQKEIVVDITPLLRNWTSGNPRMTNHGILLEAETANGKPENVSMFFPRPKCDENAATVTVQNVFLNVTLEEPNQISLEASEALKMPLLKSGDRLDNDKLASAALSQLRDLQHRLYTTPAPSRMAEPQFITLSVLEEIDHLRQTVPSREELKDEPNDEPSKGSFYDQLMKLFRSG